MLAIKLEAVYLGSDGVYDSDKSYPIIAISKSGELDLATEVVSSLMSDNGWGNFNFMRYGNISSAEEVPRKFGDKKEWEISLNEYGAVYIVYS